MSTKERSTASLIREFRDASDAKKLALMKTDDDPSETTGFRQTVSTAVTRLKRELQHDYERAYLELREIIHLVVDKEEEFVRTFVVSAFASS